MAKSYAKKQKQLAKKQEKQNKRKIQQISKDDNYFTFDDAELEDEATGGWKTVKLSEAALKTANLEGLISFEEIDGEEYFKNKALEEAGNDGGSGDDEPAEKMAKTEEQETKNETPSQPELTEEQKAKKLAKKLKKKEVLRKNKEKKRKQLAKLKAKTEGNTEEEKSAETSSEPVLMEEPISPEIFSTWTSLHVPEILLPALKNFTTPTNIQNLTIPPAIRDQQDIIGIAETGSGKTLAFSLPLVSKLIALKSENLIPQVNITNFEFLGEEQFKMRKTGNEFLPALILLPTRELAKQVYTQVQTLGKLANLTCCLIVGGLTIEKHFRMLNNRPDIIVGTPGRVHKCYEKAHPYLGKLENLAVFVLDEADRLVSTGDYKELRMLIEAIENTKLADNLTGTAADSVSAKIAAEALEGDEENQRNLTPEPIKYKRQTLLFSATIMNDNREATKVNELKNSLNLPEKNLKIIDITSQNITPETLLEYKLYCELEEKEAACYYLIREMEFNFRTSSEKDDQAHNKIIIFTNTVEQSLRLSGILRCLIRNDTSDIKLYSLHARMQQRQRLKNIENFTKNKQSILIATDVACRGLDIPKVNLIVHFSTPMNSDIYIHRSGRTARAGQTGKSIILLTKSEYTKEFKKLCTELKNKKVDFPTVELNDKIFKTIIKPAIVTAKELDVILNKQKKAGVNNKFVKEMQNKFDLSDANVEQHLLSQSNGKKFGTDNYEIRRLTSLIDEFLETRKRMQF